MSLEEGTDSTRSLHHYEHGGLYMALLIATVQQQMPTSFLQPEERVVSCVWDNGIMSTAKEIACDQLLYLLQHLAVCCYQSVHLCTTDRAQDLALPTMRLC